MHQVIKFRVYIQFPRIQLTAIRICDTGQAQIRELLNVRKYPH